MELKLTETTLSDILDIVSEDRLESPEVSGLLVPALIFPY